MPSFPERTAATPHRTGLSGERGGVVGGELLEGAGRAAARLIYERGVTGTTLDDVRSAAGVSGSQLTHYFAGKDELVRAVVGYQAGTVAGNQRQADLGTPEGLRAWRDMLVAQVQGSGGKGGCPLGSLAGQLAETDPQARAQVQHDSRPLETAVDTLLALGARK